MEILAGFLIAMAIGLTGIGGGVLTAPVLMLFLGLPAQAAVGTALLFAAVVKIFAAPMYIIRRQVDFRILAYLALGGVPGVLMGAWLLQRLARKGDTHIVLAVVGLTVVVFAARNLFRRSRPEQESRGRERRPLLAAVASVIGVEVGFSSAGAGVLGTIALMHFTQLPIASIVGTDLLFGLVISTAGGAAHLSAGAVDKGMLTLLLAGGIPGAIAGSYAATRVPARALRLGLSVWLVYLGAQLLYKGLGGFFYGS